LLQSIGLRRAFVAVCATTVAACTSVGCDNGAGDSVEHSTSELGARASDPTAVGPFATTSSEYRFDATTDPDILAGRATEIWARVYRPATLADGEKHPVLVFLHGNHGTCGRGSNPRVDDSSQYTTAGTCPPGYVVTPNHLGYGYVAERLASWGFVVVSINANRGITAGGGVSGDFGLNLARGRLVLRHLEHLTKWNANPGTTPESLGVDLAGKLDFGNVGLMGHSRGGEGVRAAYVQYNDPGSPWPARLASPLTVKAIFEVGPVDGQTDRKLNAFGTAWNVLLPMCDGDVSDLQGMRPFDRMLATNQEANASPKGMFAVWGANHNFYNTEWQTSDSQGCRGVGNSPMFSVGQSQSAKQQATGLHALMGFFRAYVGEKADATFKANYDPQFSVPQSLEDVARVERAYADAVDGSIARVLEDFSKASGTSLGGQPTVTHNVDVAHSTVAEHDSVLRAASIRWTSAADSWFEVPWTASGSGVDASTMKTLDFRVSVQKSTSALPVGFSVRLVNSDDTLSKPISIGTYLTVVPYGGHFVLDTARIPLSAFSDVDLTKVRGVRFVFDDTPQGAIYLTSVRFSRETGTHAGPNPPLPVPLVADAVPAEPIPPRVFTGNTVRALRSQPTNEVEVDLVSPDGFPILDDLPRLHIGERDILMSRYDVDGDHHRLIFTMTPAELGAVSDNAPMKVQYGDREWDFGVFRKTSIQR
jgi:hypothetical protein